MAYQRGWIGGNVVTNIVAFAALVVAGMTAWDQKLSDRKTDKERFVEHLQEIIPNCKAFTNQLGEHGPILSSCYNCSPSPIPCEDCDQSQNPVQQPLLYHHYTECKRIIAHASGELSSVDFLLMAIAAERLRFYSEASAFFQTAENESRQTPGKTDDLVVYVNLGHFEYMHRDEGSYKDSINDQGEYAYQCALSLVDSAYGDFAEIGRAEILAQWSLDTLLLGDRLADGIARVRDAVGLFTKHKKTEKRLQNYWMQLNLIASRDESVRAWLNEDRTKAMFPSHIVNAWTYYNSTPKSENPGFVEPAGGFVPPRSIEGNYGQPSFSDSTGDYYGTSGDKILIQPRLLIETKPKRMRNNNQP